MQPKANSKQPFPVLPAANPKHAFPTHTPKQADYTPNNNIID